MSDSLTVTDQASAAVAKAPRITKKFIESQLERIIFTTGDCLIAGAEYGFADHPNTGLPTVPCPDEWQPDYAHHTVCILTTKAGFTVIGHSAPASPDNFNKDLGQRLAYENAFRQLWPLFAFTALEMVEAGNTYGDFGEQ